MEEPAAANTLAPATGCVPVAVISTRVPDTLRRPGPEGIADAVKFALDTSATSSVKSPEMIAETAHCWTYPSLLSWTQSRAPPGKLVMRYPPEPSVCSGPCAYQ